MLATFVPCIAGVHTCGSFRGRCLDGLPARNNKTMITIGVILMLCGLLLGIPILLTVGLILLVVGLLLLGLGNIGRPLGGRAHYW